LFYNAFPIRDALRHELSWTHYRLLLRVDSSEARAWYLQEAVEQHWRGKRWNCERKHHDHRIPLIHSQLCA
jgi:hypothetical protein